MLLNRHNLNIAALCSKEQSRFALNSIFVTPEATIETDGHQLVKVTLPPGTKADSFPQLPNSPAAVDDWKPFLLPASEATAIARALPKKATLPVLQCAAVTAESDVNGHSSIAITDLEMARVFRTRKPEANFPDYERCVPKKEDAEFRIAFDASIVRRVLQQIESFKSDERKPACIFSFTGGDKAMRIDATGGDGQELAAVIMPLRDIVENPVHERRKQAEALLEKFITDYEQNEKGARKIYRTNLYSRACEVLREPQAETKEPGSTPEPESVQEPEKRICSQCQEHEAEPDADLCASCAATWEPGAPTNTYADQDQISPGSHLDDNGNESSPEPVEIQEATAPVITLAERPADWATWGAGRKAAWTRKQRQGSAPPTSIGERFAQAYAS